MRPILTAGLVAAATVLGTWAALPAAHATTRAPATAVTSNGVSPGTSPLPSRPGALPVRHQIAWPAGVTPAATSPFNEYSGVSCFHAGDCIAVGGNATANGGHASPIAALWNGRGWTSTPVPLPSGGTAGYLNGVSCKPGGCVAVGFYYRGAVTYNLAEYWNGRKWTSSSQPPAISGAKYPYLGAVDCYSATHCVAAGGYVPTSNKYQEIAFADVWNGHSWRTSLTPPPGPYHYADFYVISCPTASYCLLGGLYASPATSNGYFATLLESFDLSHWHQLSDAAPNPTGGYASFIDGIDCTSSTACVAVGEDDIFSARTVWHGFAEALGGSGWQLESVGLPAGPQSYLNDLSCATALYCVAVGGIGPYNSSYTGGKSIYAVWNGSTWAYHYLPSLPSGQGSFLFGDQCLTTTYCVAVGTEGPYNKLSAHGLTGFWNGTKWTLINRP